MDMVEQATRVNAEHADRMLLTQQNAMRKLKDKSGDEEKDDLCLPTLPPRNNYLSLSGHFWSCCDGTKRGTPARRACGHHAHKECIESSTAPPCSLCQPSDSECDDRDSDIYYDTDEQDAVEEDALAARLEEDAALNVEISQHQSALKFVQIKGTNITLSSPNFELANDHVSQIKDAHIELLRKNLSAKLVLAEKINPFKIFLPERLCIQIKRLDEDFDLDSLAQLVCDDESFIDYLDAIKYGEAEIELISGMFEHALDQRALMIEWQTFRYKLGEAWRCKLKYKAVCGLYLNDDVWTTSNPNLSIIFTILVVLALSSVNTERAFSGMNIIKTWLTNRMSVSLVSDVLLLKEAKLCPWDRWTVRVVATQFLEQIVDEFKKIKERRGPRGV